MGRVIFDSWAWMEYFRGSDAGEEVKSHLEKDDVFIHAVSITEVVSKLIRQGRDIDEARQSFASLTKVVDTDRGSAVRTGQVHAAIRRRSPNFSLADAYVLEAAMRLRLKVVTGDPDFKGVKEAEFLR